MIDKSDKKGKMSLERWKIVEMEMLNELIEYMVKNAEKPIRSIVQTGL